MTAKKNEPYPFETVIGENGEVVKFDPENVKRYLDWAIEKWRQKREEAANAENHELVLIASCYIDAFQSVRSSLFGKLKP